MLRTLKVTEVFGMPVYTDEGDYFGEVEESIIANNKLFGWKIRATKNSFLNKVLGSAKGVIVPHQYVRSIGDILIVNKMAVPNYNSEEE